MTRVDELLRWLRARGDPWATALGDDAVQVTVNRQFAVPQTPVRDADEVAFVPRRR